MAISLNNYVKVTYRLNLRTPINNSLLNTAIYACINRPSSFTVGQNIKYYSTLTDLTTDLGNVTWTNTAPVFTTTSAYKNLEYLLNPNNATGNVAVIFATDTGTPGNASTINFSTTGSFAGNATSGICTVNITNGGAKLPASIVTSALGVSANASTLVTSFANALNANTTVTGNWVIAVNNTATTDSSGIPAYTIRLTEKSPSLFAPVPTFATVFAQTPSSGTLTSTFSNGTALTGFCDVGNTMNTAINWLTNSSQGLFSFITFGDSIANSAPNNNLAYTATGLGLCSYANNSSINLASIYDLNHDMENLNPTGMTQQAKAAGYARSIISEGAELGTGSPILQSAIVAYANTFNPNLPNSSYSIAWKTFDGQAPNSIISDSAFLNATKTNYGNVYVSIAGSNRLLDGVSPTGVAFDVYHQIIRLANDIQTNVISSFNSRKLPQNTDGINIVSGYITGILRKYQNTGFINSDPSLVWNGDTIPNSPVVHGSPLPNGGGYYVYNPGINSLSDADRAAFKLPPFTVPIQLAGSAISVSIDLPIQT